jgi:hypothetical protein
LSAVNCFGNKPDPSFDRILINDLLRQLASYLNLRALPGGGSRICGRRAKLK